MKHRSTQKELMDLGPEHYSMEEYYDCLNKLGWIGKLLGGDRATLKEFKKVKNIESVLDFGCGGGDFCHKLAKNYPKAKIVGIDIDENAIKYAKKTYQLPNLAFEHRISPKLNEPKKSFDIVTSTLVFHHLSEDEITFFLKSAEKIAKKAIIINDLQRSRLAYYLFKLISKVFRNRLISFDGLISITRGFHKNDIKKFLSESGIKNYSLKWYWAFRWLININVI